MHLIKT